MPPKRSRTERAFSPLTPEHGEHRYGFQRSGQRPSVSDESVSDEPPRISDRPVLAAVGIFLIAGFIFGGIELLLTSSVDFLGTILFAFVFAVAYVGGAIYLGR